MCRDCIVNKTNGVYCYNTMTRRGMCCPSDPKTPLSIDCLEQNTSVNVSSMLNHTVPFLVVDIKYFYRLIKMNAVGLATLRLIILHS